MAKNLPRFGSEVWKNAQGEGQGPWVGQGCGQETKRRPRAKWAEPRVQSLLLPQPGTVPTTHMRWRSRAKLASGVHLSAEQWSICFGRGFFFFFFFLVSMWPNTWISRSEEGQRNGKSWDLINHKGLEEENMTKSVLSLPAHVLIIWTKVVGLGDMLTANAISLKVIKLLQKLVLPQW